MGAESADLTDQFDVLVVGGGNGGISAAARLLRRGVTDVAVIEPLSVHTYRPLLSYVGGGQASMRSAERTQRSVTPKQCRWLQDSAVRVDPAARIVHCASGHCYGYRDLILCAGLVPDHDALPGIDAAMATPAVASNYLDEAEKTWKLVRDMPVAGRAVFTVPRPPVSCTGTTVKPVFLAAAHWRRTGRLRDIDITLVIDRPRFLGVPDVDDRLLDRLAYLGIDVRHATAVTALNPDAQTITISGGDELPYDMLHLVPPLRGARGLDESDLTPDGSHRRGAIAPRTLRHLTHPDVWAAGDGADLQTDSSGGALRKQIAVLVDNLLAARTGQPLQHYDGYTVAPVTTDARRLVFGEFDRSGALASSLPSFLDPLEPRWTTWAFDRYGLPQTYWHGILKGRL